MPRLNVPVPVPEGSKWCPACGGVKLLAEFNTDRHRVDGRRTYCRPCDKAKSLVTHDKRVALRMAAKRMTEPHKVTPAEREAHNAAVVTALDDIYADAANCVASILAAKSIEPPKPRAAPEQLGEHPGNPAGAASAHPCRSHNRAAPQGPPKMEAYCLVRHRRHPRRLPRLRRSRRPR